VTPYYDHAGITIYHGDCLAVMPELPELAERFDLVFTSPPYNLGGEPWPHLGHWKPGDGTAGGRSKWRNGSDACGGVAYACHGDAMPWPEYVAWQQDCLKAMFGMLSDRGSVYYNHKPRVIGGRLWLPLELNPGLPLRQIVIWARAGGMNFNPTAYVPTHEWIMVFAREHFRLRDKGASGAGDVWRVPQEANALHPAPFPVALPRLAIDTTGAQRILDPFAGIGSTLRAAKDARRHAVGIEINECYCEIAARRLEQGVLSFGGDA
jgi:site-specific DNA-methyltransferase (adenine-specific)